MAEAKVLSGAGLRGQVAGQTALSTVGQAGAGLTYRGYDVRELAADAQFEEVAYLLLYGELPTKAELAAYSAKLSKLRDLPQALKEVLERIPADAHPMDVMRTGCSFLGNLEPEQDFSVQRDVTDRLLAAFPAIMCYWYRFSHDGKRIDCVTDEPSLGGHFLHLLHRCDRLAARPAARRCQRSGDGNDRALPVGRGRRRRHPRHAGAQGQDHGLRPRDLQRLRPA